MLLPVAVIVEEVLKKTFKFGYVNNNGLFIQLLKNSGLLVIHLDPRVEKLKKQIGEAAGFVRQQAGVLIIGTTQDFVDPSVRRAAVASRRCFFLFGHNVIRIGTARTGYSPGGPGEV